MSKKLGDYYQDISGAIDLVESGYHGTLDPAGVPVLESNGRERHANATTTAQYALANMTALRRGQVQREERARVLLDWLVETQVTAGPLVGCWLMPDHNRKYPWLRAPWISSLALGNGISALLRGWELFDVERYLSSAEAAYEALHRVKAPDPLVDERDDALWYEEYPAEPPLHVLNGHVYTLFAVLDYARVTGDPQAQDRWRRGAATVRVHLDEFDLGYWSAYDLRWREPTSVHYHKNIHVPLLRILGLLTEDGMFATVADRWEGYLDSRSGRARWAIALRLQRFRRR